jgi:hypothetical protein
MTYKWVYDFVYWQSVVGDLSMIYTWVYDFVYWQFVVSDLRLTYIISGSMTLYTGSLLSVISA